MTEPTDNRRRARFSLGQTVITATAMQQLTNLDVLTAMGRHVRGDWGDIDDGCRELSLSPLGESLFHIVE